MQEADEAPTDVEVELSLSEATIQRDRRFLWRLVAGLTISTLGGIWLFGMLTGGWVTQCATRSYETLTGPPRQPPAAMDH